MGLDWLKSSEEERQALYRTTKEIIDNLGLSWVQLFDQSLGMTFRLEYPTDNFSKGTIKRAYAKRIYDWIAANHLDLAVRISPELFHPSLKSDWQRFVEDKGQYGQVTLCFADQRSLSRRSDQQPVAETKVAFGRDYGFMLDSAVSGMVMGLEEYRGRYYPLSLGPDDISLAIPCKTGVQQIPFDHRQSKEIWLRELDDPGKHGFVFLVGPAPQIDGCYRGLEAQTPIRDEQLDRMAYAFEDADAGSFALYRINVIFTV